MAHREEKKTEKPGKEEKEEAKRRKKEEKERLKHEEAEKEKEKKRQREEGKEKGREEKDKHEHKHKKKKMSAEDRVNLQRHRLELELISKGEIPWEQSECRPLLVFFWRFSVIHSLFSGLDGDSIERLVTFDLSRIPLAKRSNILLGAVDITSQLLSFQVVQQHLLPYDNPDIEAPNAQDEALLSEVPKHLESLVVRLMVDDNMKQDFAVSQVLPDASVPSGLYFNTTVSANAFCRDLQGLPFARYPTFPQPLTHPHPNPHLKGHPGLRHYSVA